MENNSDSFKLMFDYIKEHPDKVRVNKFFNELDTLQKENKKFSDLIDKDGNFYINLVQEGGGTLGIALVGFVSILEFCKIRFLNLAGTSAGAINTALLYFLDTPDKAKSPELFSILKDQMDLRKFIDGNRFSRFIVNNLLNKTGIIDAFGVVFITTSLLLLFTIPILTLLSEQINAFTFTILCLFITVTVTLFFYIKSLKKYNYSLNDGGEFYNFIKTHIRKYDVKYDINPLIEFNKNNDADDLIENFLTQLSDEDRKITEAFKSIKGKRLLKDLSEFKFSYRVITSENVSQNKIEFPEDSDLFWSNEADDFPHPAEYVRASMSIPLFFKPHIKTIRTESPAIQKAWKEKMNYETFNIPSEAWFTDGGTLSNFPINIFHDPSVILARVPVIGARLKDTKDPEKMIRPFSNILQFWYGIFKTIRFNYDKSFLRKNKFYEKYCVSNIDVYESKISWLDFTLNEDQKRELIFLGMEAALKHLQNFDWKVYQMERAKMVLNND